MVCKIKKYDKFVDAKKKQRMIASKTGFTPKIVRVTNKRSKKSIFVVR